MTTLLTVVVPVRLVSEANTGGRMRERIKRKLAVKNAVDWHLMLADRDGSAMELDRIEDRRKRFHVTMTRIGPRALDDDNLAYACKAARDRVAKWLGVDDGDTKRVTWSYAQEKGKPREYAVRIEIARRGSE